LISGPIIRGCENRNPTYLVVKGVLQWRPTEERNPDDPALCIFTLQGRNGVF